MQQEITNINCDKNGIKKVRERTVRISDEEIKQYVESHIGIYDHIDFIGKHRTVFYYCKHHLSKGLLYDDITRLRSRNCICRYCSGRGKTTDEYKAEVAELHPDIEILGEYYGYDKRIKCRCLVCGTEWETRAGQLTSAQRLRGCPTCGKIIACNKRRYSLEYFKEMMAVTNPHIEVVGEYNNSHSFIQCRCRIHNVEFYSYPCNLLNHMSNCPMCGGGIGVNERRVGRVLEELKIDYIAQYTFPDCKRHRALQFDYFLPKYNILIEYDGEQHFHPVKIFGGEAKFMDQKERDDIKNQYCRENNIPLIRVPYTVKTRLKSYLISQLKQHITDPLFEPERLTGRYGNVSA